MPLILLHDLLERPIGNRELQSFLVVSSYEFSPNVFGWFAGSLYAISLVQGPAFDHFP